MAPTNFVGVSSTHRFSKKLRHGGALSSSSSSMPLPVPPPVGGGGGGANRYENRVERKPSMYIVMDISELQKGSPAEVELPSAAGDHMAMQCTVNISAFWLVFRRMQPK